MSATRVKIHKAFLDGREVLAGKDLEADIEFDGDWLRSEVGAAVVDLFPPMQYVIGDPFKPIPLPPVPVAPVDTVIVHGTDADL